MRTCSAFHDEVVDDDALTYGLNWYRAMFLSFPAMKDAIVRVPTTFVWSDGDVAVTDRGGRRTPEYMEAPYEAVTLPGVSHWIPTEAPEALAEHILKRIASVQ